MVPKEDKIAAWSLPVPSQKFPADLILEYLKQLEVEFVFGIPGGAIEPFFDGLARSARTGGPRIIVSRHETSAAFMADGYNHYSGKLGVCCATTGPGATNLITGIASAYANQIPMLVITAQTALPNFGKGALQESSCTGVNTVAMMESCTRYNSFVSHPDQLEHKLAAAITTAFGPIPGPVHLSVPFDIWRVPAQNSTPKYYLPDLLPNSLHANPVQIEKTAQLLKTAKHCTFIVGERSSEAMTNILVLAQLLNADVVTTPHAKALVNSNHPRYQGVIGFAGHQRAAQAVSASRTDCIVTIGTLLSEFAISGLNPQVLSDKTLVHIDQNYLNFTLSAMADLRVYGVIDSTISALISQLSCELPIADRSSKMFTGTSQTGKLLNKEELKNYYHSGTPIHPARLMLELPKLLPKTTRYFPDCGNSYAWAIHYLHIPERRINGVRHRKDELFKACIEFSSMGWAISCAIGAALALPQTPIVCITGDGSLLMSGQEITVAVQERLPVIFIVLNDSAYGMVKHGQRLTGAERFAYQLPKIDFTAYAQAMGVEAYRIESPQDLQQLQYLDFENRTAPLLLDVQIDAEAVPPIKQRTKVLQKESA